jgi:hypothetical protein
MGFSGFVSNGRMKGRVAETAATQAASHPKACRLRDKGDQGVACGRGVRPTKGQSRAADTQTTENDGRRHGRHCGLTVSVLR